MSLNAYPDYKESGADWLGNIPSHWQAQRGKYLFEIQKRIAGEEGYDVLSITQKGIRVKDITANDGQLAADYAKYQHVHVGDFAMNHMDLLTGYADIASVKGVTSPDYRVFTIREPKNAEPRYFLYLVQNAYRQKIYYAFGQGASEFGRWRLPTDQFNDFVYPVPELAEQKAIVRFLDRETAKIDALIAEQEMLLTLLAEKRQATISHAVTKGLNKDAPMKDSGVTWLGEVPEHWDIVGLTKYVESVVDYRGKTPEKVDDGTFLVTAKNIRDGRIDYEASQEYIKDSDYAEVMRRGIPSAGDVLFTTEAPLGQVALVDRVDIALAQRVIKFRVVKERLDNTYLKFWIMGQSCQFNLLILATGSTALGIKGSKIGQVKMCLPPVSEQIAIVKHIEDQLAKLNELDIHMVTAIDLLKERRSAILAAAVTGKINVHDHERP